MDLADFIEKNIEHFLAEWVSFARTRLPAARVMDETMLRNGAESMLRALAHDMRSKQSRTQQAEKSRGERPQSGPAITDTAKQHAAERLGSGFTLDQLVSEYRALRASVSRHWTEEMNIADKQMLAELIRFDEAVDQSLTEAVRWFHQGLDEARHLFIGMLGHDLRDPLNAILTAARVQQKEDDIATQRNSAKTIEKSGQRMSEMITNILDFAQTRLGRHLPIARESIDLSACCGEIVQELSLSSGERKIDLECQGDLTGTWDPGRMKQMLANLISNALHHGDAAFPVTVRASGEPHRVVVTVHNAGPAIPQERHYTIFDPLIRDDATEGRGPHQGIGLGLYIVQEIVAAHGGEIALTSTVDEGTIFSVWLPRDEAGRTAAGR